MNQVTIETYIAAFPKRLPESHKGDFGHLLVISGSAGYSGAPYLTSQAAMRAGAGLVTLAIGKSLHGILATKLTEVMVKPFYETKDYSLSLLAEKDILHFAEKCSAFAIGPGISQNKETQHLVRNLIGKITVPVILDADGINAFVGYTDSFKNTKAKLVLTPHPGELSRLTGIAVEEVQKNRKDIALKYANEYNTVLVLKGHETIVAHPGGDFFVNETGNPGLAKGGSGDVLTGIIAGLIAQGSDPFTAAILGVHFHGLTADIAVKTKGILSLAATDLLETLPEALKKLA